MSSCMDSGPDRVRKASPCSVRITRGNPLHYLRLYFNCCYYVGVIPFRFQFDPEAETYKLHTSPIQKGFCLLTMSLCICEEMIFFRDSLKDIRNPPKGDDDPLVYFNMFHTCSNFLYYVTVINTVWFKSKQFLAVVQFLHERRSLPDSERGQSTNMKAKVCCSITLLPFVIYPTTFVASFFIRKADWTWNQKIDFWGLNASRPFFLEPYFPQFSYPLRIIFAILRNLYLLGYTQLTTSVEMIIFNSAMLLNDSVSDFSTVVKDTANFSSRQILSEYQFLRTLSRKLNKAVGFLTFGLTLACMPYYVVNLLEFIKPANVAVFFRHLLFFSNTFGFLILAAHVNKKAHMLEEWLITGREFTELPPTTLAILLHDLSGRSIGFNGSGFFRITPAFLGTIISLLLTFSIIIIQFKTSIPVTPSAIV